MKFINNRRSWQILGLLSLDGLLFGLTDAGAVPSFMVIVGFGLFSLTLYSVVYALVGLGSLYGLTIKRKKSLSLYLTAIIGGLIALQSIGQLGSRDMLVLLPLALIAYIYSIYAKRAGV